MKIAMVTTYATPRNVRSELLETMVARGHAATVIAPEPTDIMQAPLAKIGVGYERWEVDRTRIDPVADLRAVHHLSKILRRGAYGVVLTYQIKAVLLTPLAARLARVRKVVALVNGLGSVFDESGFGKTWKARVARRVYGLSLRGVDHVVFQNHDDPELLRHFGLLAAHAPSTVVPGTGVDIEKLRSAAPHIDPPTFTLVSRLLVSKGIREFIAAARAIRADYPAARFRLVGALEAPGHPDGISQDELDGWVDEGLVEYLGFTDDIAGVLATTTVFVLPSYYREGVPRTNLEALAIGRPVVTTDWVGCRDTVEDGVNGFLIAPRDVTALVDRLRRYLRDPELVRAHGSASRALAERRFDIRRVNEMMLDVLEH